MTPASKELWYAALCQQIPLTPQQWLDALANQPKPVPPASPAVRKRGGKSRKVA